jgi:hypothetical protein
VIVQVSTPIGLLALMALPLTAARNAAKARLLTLCIAVTNNSIDTSDRAIDSALEGIELEEAFIDFENRRQDVLYRRLRQLKQQSTALSTGSKSS